MTFVGLLALVSAGAMVLIARWIRMGKAAEAVGSTTAIAQAAAAYYNESDSRQPAGTKPDQAKAMRHFPPPSRADVPAEPDSVRGKKYQSAIGDWSVSPWHDMRFSITQPQHYAYGFESEGSGPTARASALAHGDLDGNGVQSTFKATVAPDSELTAVVSPTIERVDPDE
jgi:hypothetical protein